ncbi:hypothetical protein, partial [Acinetobacter baumannii]|uniref:hypothetical protein n=1 Tax=Acinetobacter baumannii TaxID=470 RepID=UPI001D17A4BB
EGGETAEVAFPYFGGILHEHFQHAEGESIQLRRTGELVSPLGSIGYRWGEKGKWNIEAREGKDGRDVDLSLTQIEGGETAEVAFPYFGGILHEHFQHAEGESIQLRR